MNPGTSACYFEEMKRNAVGVILVIGVMAFCIGNPSGATNTFSPSAHKAALLKLLDTVPGSPGGINRLRITPSKVNSTWVYYVAGIRVSTGSGTTTEDSAVGYAHFISGRWINVLGPGTGDYCADPASFHKIPFAIRKSFGLNC